MLPAAERPVVERALSKKPEERWPSCGAFVEALCQGNAVTAPAPRRRQPWRSLVVACCLGLLAVSLLAWWYRPAEQGPTHANREVNFDGLPVFVFDGKSRIVTEVERFAPVTLEAWVCPLAADPGVQERYIIGSDIRGASGICLGMRYNAWSKSRGDWDFEHPPQLLVSVLPGAKSHNLYLPMGQSLPHDRWSHVAAVFASEQTTVFLDGELVAKGVPSAGSGGTSFVIACAGRDNPVAYFKGQMRAARISRGERYQSSFSPAEEFVADGSAVLIYSASQTEGERALDMSGNGNDGILQGVKVLEPLKKAGDGPE
jgi:hypothetical protein